ncbi:hypothetical protein ACX80L_15600 [Arthrobacter sp. MDT1-48-3]
MRLSLPQLERDFVVHAVNELISETPRHTAPYSNDPDEPEALVALGLKGVLADLDRPGNPSNPGDREGPDDREDPVGRKDDVNEGGREQGG